jgi:hypothetical protein
MEDLKKQQAQLEGMFTGSVLAFWGACLLELCFRLAFGNVTFVTSKELEWIARKLREYQDIEHE